MFCSNCGKELPDNAKFCSACGASAGMLTQAPEPQPEPPQPEPKADEPLFASAPEPVVPAENRPLGPWAYFGYSILFSIPVIGFILLIIFSFAGKNINRKNFARSYWCWFILMLAIILILVVVLLTGILRGVTENVGQWLNSIGLDWLAHYFL